MARLLRQLAAVEACFTLEAVVQVHRHTKTVAPVRSDLAEAADHLAEAHPWAAVVVALLVEAVAAAVADKKGKVL